MKLDSFILSLIENHKLEIDSSINSCLIISPQKKGIKSKPLYVTLNFKTKITRYRLDLQSILAAKLQFVLSVKERKIYFDILKKYTNI